MVVCSGDRYHAFVAARRADGLETGVIDGDVGALRTRSKRGQVVAAGETARVLVGNPLDLAQGGYVGQVPVDFDERALGDDADHGRRRDDFAPR
jgi:hypothetical protein